MNEFLHRASSEESYRLSAREGIIIRESDGASIPQDPGNRDWQIYLEWLATGNQPGPYVPPPAPLIDISDRQFFQALAISGAITQQEALLAVKTGEIPAAFIPLIDAIADPNEQFATRMLLSGATQFQRHHPLVKNFGYALGWSDEEIDELWRTAIKL